VDAARPARNSVLSHVAVGAQFIRTLCECCRLCRRAHGRVGKNYRSGERGRIRATVQVGAVALPCAGPFEETHVAGLVHRGPLACVRKLRRKFARCRGLFRTVADLARDFDAAGARKLLQ